MTVGVRELKQHLSKYLERAARGEVIVVTDRGATKAILGPPPKRHPIIDKGIAEGWIRSGNGEPPRPARRFKSKLTTEKTLDEDRGD
jgi:prevent-host-death family protein